MKKKILCFLLAFAFVIPCAFMLVGCGNNDGQFGTAKVNVDGNYTALTDKTELQTATQAAGLEEDKTFGYKMTMNCNSDEINFDTTIIVTTNENKTITGMAGKFKVYEGNQSFTTEFYAPNDGYVYAKAKIMSFSVKAKSPIESFDVIADDYSSGIDQSEAITEILNALGATSGITFEKAEVGNQIKYHIINNNETTNSYNYSDIYVVFENSNLVGIKMVGTITEGGNNANYTVSIVPFDGEISYPTDLSSYPLEII